MKIQLSHNYNNIVNVDNLLNAWTEFIKGKRKKKDVQEFNINLMDNILSLNQRLINKEYQHGKYYHFKINDPKPRDIHKASVEDRLVHHAIYRILYPFFDKVFCSDSYSCRLNKGAHKAINRFRDFAYKVGRNDIRTCWVLKCDIKKFFSSIDHEILLDILRQYISDKDILWLLDRIVNSFHSSEFGVGLPLGNLTSQLLVNIYMNEFDQFVKHKLKIKYYTRYADDFVILSDNRGEFESYVKVIQSFLNVGLRLKLHPNKVFIETIYSGVDFLGWVHFSDHRILRTKTKRRMLKRINSDSFDSYLGSLKHGNSFKLENMIFDQYFQKLVN